MTANKQRPWWKFWARKPRDFGFDAPSKTLYFADFGVSMFEADGVNFKDNQAEFQAAIDAAQREAAKGYAVQIHFSEPKP